MRPSVLRNIQAQTRGRVAWISIKHDLTSCSIPIQSYSLLFVILLSTTSEFMAVNFQGRGQSPEAKDSYVAIHLNVVDNKCYIPIGINKMLAT